MNGIKRKRTLGIALQNTPNVPETNATYWLPVIDFDGNPEVVKVENEAWTGSRYKSNDSAVVRRHAKPSMTLKVDENILPLLLLPFGPITSGTQSGDSNVKVHTITFSNNNQPALYTLFLDDPDRTDQIFSDFRPEKIDFKINKNGYITLEMSGISRFPVNGTVTPSLTAWNEFTSAHSTFRIADVGGTLTSITLLECSMSHSFGLSGDDDNHNLGSIEHDQSFNTESEFMHEVTLLYPDLTYRNKWTDNTKQQFEVKFEDTSRIITGSTTNVNPSVVFTYPVAYLSEWSEDGGPGDILKQKQTIKVLDAVGVADSPLKITIKNSVASY